MYNNEKQHDHDSSMITVMSVLMTTWEWRGGEYSARVKVSGALLSFFFFNIRYFFCYLVPFFFSLGLHEPAPVPLQQHQVPPRQSNPRRLVPAPLLDGGDQAPASSTRDRFGCLRGAVSLVNRDLQIACPYLMQLNYPITPS